MKIHKNNKIKGKYICNDDILAEISGVSQEEVEKLNLYQQRLSLQKFALKLDADGTTILRETALELNNLYNRLTTVLDYEYGVDLSCDYIIDFLCFVEEEEYQPRC